MHLTNQHTPPELVVASLQRLSIIKVPERTKRMRLAKLDYSDVNAKVDRTARHTRS